MHPDLNPLGLGVIRGDRASMAIGLARSRASLSCRLGMQMMRVRMMMMKGEEEVLTGGGEPSVPH